MRKDSALTFFLAVSMIALVMTAVVVCIKVWANDHIQVTESVEIDPTKFVYVYDGPYDLPDSIDLMVDPNQIVFKDTIYLIPNSEIAGY